MRGARPLRRRGAARPGRHRPRPPSSRSARRSGSPPSTGRRSSRASPRGSLARSRAARPSAIEALASTRLDGRRLASTVALGVISHLALSAVFFATAGALDLSVGAFTLLAVGNAIVIAVLLPVSVGGVGVREGVAVVLLASAGVASSDAVLVALLGYLTGQVPALFGGVLFALRRAERPPVLAEQTLS
ncbi:MAG: lysylphosphatidylglycerol synthase domain-containing protein [Sandaracinaceae bacterium]|nr:lysylphosphatidylglycerol synthase domain-containing protein [Sandaracinaceae bacterium]